MSLSPTDWHKRFSQQARWTQSLRKYLYGRASVRNAHRVLDVGCGTGVLLQEATSEYTGSNRITYGIDLDQDFLSHCTHNAPSSLLTQGDAHNLPYSTSTFDLALCHFLLLWVSNPEYVVKEMMRVTRHGGAVIAFAEPDYGGRIDYPQELAKLGEWQKSALVHQGADPLLGRRLAGIFSAAGLEIVETGVLGGQWKSPPSQDDWETEWAVIQFDLSDSAHNKDIIHLKTLDASAWQSGERVLFVPTFYAWGRVPKKSLVQG